MSDIERRPDNYIDALKAKISIDAWSKPGIRYAGLRQEDFSLLATLKGYAATSLDKVTLVTKKGEYKYNEDFVFDRNGRLVGGPDETLEYDHLGRLITYHRSKNGFTSAINETTDRYEYPLSGEDSHYTRIHEALIENQYSLAKETWELRQEKEKIRASGYEPL